MFQKTIFSNNIMVVVYFWLLKYICSWVFIIYYYYEIKYFFFHIMVLLSTSVMLVRKIIWRPQDWWIDDTGTTGTRLKWKSTGKNWGHGFIAFNFYIHTGCVYLVFIGICLPFIVVWFWEGPFLRRFKRKHLRLRISKHISLNSYGLISV